LALLFAVAIKAAPPTIDYNFQIRPILADRCFVCHGPDERTRKAGLRLDNRESALAKNVIVPGKPDESKLIAKITAGPSDRMPPIRSNLSLSKSEIEVLRQWIAEGAQYKAHWAFEPLPKETPIPSVRAVKWPRNPIDQFILSRLEREGLTPAAAARREDWLRRVTFDLTGLPPTPAEVDAFLADRTATAFENVVDRLLKSTRFGERMAMEWLDVARYADSFGYQADGDTHVWPWRDWVIEAFNRNLPFDQFITWQIAGDLLPNASREQRIATAFNRLHRMTNEGGSIPEEWRLEYVADRVHTFGTVFLGLTFECTRCHDHKYDPLTMRDYYSLSAFFNNIDEWGTYDNSAFRPTPTLRLSTPEQDKSIATLQKDVEAKAARLLETIHQRESAFREWLANAATAKPLIPGLVGDYTLDERNGNQLINRANAKAPGSSSGANALVDGRAGKALKFTGDDPAHFPNVLGSIERWQSFSVSFWLHLPDSPKEGIVFHRQSGTDTGFHGVEMSFEDGKLRFALVRYWPGNMAAIQTKAPISPKRWVQITATYDGSSLASGLRLYIDGGAADCDILRDSLDKDLQSQIGHGAGSSGLTFGERFRSTGLKDCLLDEVRIFDRSITEIEAAHLFDNRSLVEALTGKDEKSVRKYYFAAVDPEVAKARAALADARRQWFAAQTGVFEIMAMQEMPSERPSYILARGAYDAPRDRPAPRAMPAQIAATIRNGNSKALSRLDLAKWIADPSHPLTARVAVNRYWQMFFGRGLVATAENFGTQGALPTHPELLDWLARDFISSKWDVKALCRQIVLSETYRQLSATSASTRERDPENLLLARAPARRLSAEMLRDAFLYNSGLLVDKVGGPPVKPYQPPGMWRGMNAFLPEYVADKGEGLYRRSMYTFWRRTSPPPNMLAFDMPGREVCNVRRQSTTTPLQPLVLLNDPQFVEAARGLAERMLKEGGATVESRVTFAFRLAATRAPEDREVKLLSALFREQLALFRGDPESTKKFLRIGDKAPASGVDAAELAAAAATAGAILNLDAAVMMR
jgi:hypothetical protein